MRRLDWHVGDVIQKLRALKDMKAGRLAAKTGLNKATIGRIEAGTTDPKSTTLDKIARALDVRLEDLYALIPQAEPTAEGWQEREELWAQLDEESQRTWLQNLRHYVSLARRARGAVDPSHTAAPSSGTPVTTRQRSPKRA